VMENYAGLPVIEASHGIALLEGVEHNHVHGEVHLEDDAMEEQEHENHEHEEENHEHEEHDHAEDNLEHESEGHNHTENGHVWMNVEYYRTQLAATKSELQQLLPQQKDALEAAADAYDKKLQELSTEVETLKEKTKEIPVVIFHEAFAYLAESLEMDVLVALSLDEETVPSAGEIAEVIEEIRYHGYALVLIEEDYAEHAEKILAETEAEVVYINPLTTGDGSADSYLEGMRSNLEAVRVMVE